jgi:hypothetical protein
VPLEEAVMSETPAVRTHRQDSVADRLGKQPNRSLTLPAWAGIIGPVLFTAGFLAQEALRRDEYDPLAEPVSALEAGPKGGSSRPTSSSSAYSRRHLR